MQSQDAIQAEHTLLHRLSFEGSEFRGISHKPHYVAGLEFKVGSGVEEFIVAVHAHHQRVEFIAYMALSKSPSDEWGAFGQMQ